MKYAEKFLPVIKTIIILILFSLLTVGEAFGEKEIQRDTSMGHSGAEDVVVARVNGVEINMSQLMKKMIEIAEKKYGRGEISPLVASKIKADATEKLIIEELAFQRSDKAVDFTDEMLDAMIAEMRKNYDRPEPFEEYAKLKFGSLEAAKEQVKRVETVKLFIKKEIEEKLPELTDQELKDAYMGDNDKYIMKQERVEVSDITFFLEPGKQTSLEKINHIMTRIAKEADNDPNKLRPDGTFIVQKDVILNKQKDSELYNAAKILGEYGFSKPILLDGTYHIVQLTGYQPEISKTFDEVKDNIRLERKRKLRQQKVDEWVAGLKEGASIEIIDVLD